MFHPIQYIRDVAFNGYELKYYPPKQNSGKPFVLICPGGGYRCVMASAEGVPVAKAFSALGYPAFVLRYHVREQAKLPSPMDDLARAVREIIDGNGTRWQVKTEGYAVCGFSAGGHLAASFGTESLGYAHYGLPRPGAMLLSYPVITMGEFTHAGTRDLLLGENAPQSRLDAASIEKLVTANYPPTFVWNSREDELVPPCNGEMLAGALEGAGVTYTFQQFPSGRHGCGLGKGTACEPWLGMAVAFWEKQV